ncbi:MAG: stage III sporulation protein AA [Defluviitaleaceae bacterium]|nr:stage III sporulation protein AA [Defluviitaleaceae bacterium]
MKKEIIKYMSPTLQEIFENISMQDFEVVKEIRLRVFKNIILNTHNGEFTITKNSVLEKDICKGYIVTKNDIFKTIELLSDFSLYAFENELKKGYITVYGGNRVGICGTAVIENDNIKTMKDFSGINIRLSAQIFGAGDDLIRYIKNIDTKSIFNTLIISSPACGKTTMLRDIIKQLSYGVSEINPLNIGVVDERGEIAASYMGVAQNDLGPRTDVLDSCPKSIGMIMLLRAMAPDVIAVDELGEEEDMKAIETIINSGVKLIATVHGGNIEEIKNKKNLKYIVKQKVFERYVILNKMDKYSRISHIYDKNFNTIWSYEKIKEEKISGVAV